MSRSFPTRIDCEKCICSPQVCEDAGYCRLLPDTRKDGDSDKKKTDREGRGKKENNDEEA